jgi:hypothetical protein
MRVQPRAGLLHRVAVLDAVDGDGQTSFLIACCLSPFTSQSDGIEECSNPATHAGSSWSRAKVRCNHARS